MLFIYLFYCGSNLSHARTRVILLKRVQQELSVVLQAQADQPRAVFCSSIMQPRNTVASGAEKSTLSQC